MSDRVEIRVPGLAEPISHYTDAVRAGDLLFVSGCIAVDGDGRLVDGDVVAQTRQVFGEPRCSARRRRRRVRRRRQGDRLPHGRRRPQGGEHRAAGGVRRRAPREHARRGQPPRDPRRARRDRGCGARPVDSWNAVITEVEPAAAMPGPLHGRTLLVKDLIDTAGVRTTYGSQIYADHVPDRTATAVERLVAAGAVVVGKANLHEFAWGVTSQNPWYGTVQNPRLPGTHERRVLRAATPRRSQPGSASSASAPTPAARSGCPRRAAASSGSSRAGGACRSTACTRSARRSTPSGRWRRPSRTSRSCGRCSPVSRCPSRASQG